MKIRNFMKKILRKPIEWALTDSHLEVRSIRTQGNTLFTNQIKEEAADSGTQFASGNLIIPVKAYAGSGVDGVFYALSSNNYLYIRLGAAWKSGLVG